MSLKIFYIDDEPLLLEMFVDTFSDANREIKTFTDPKAAIEAVRKSPPDIIFVDYRLPDFTGDQIAESLDPKIPKVLITGDLTVKSKYKFDAVFLKPYLSADIEAFLNSKFHK